MSEKRVGRIEISEEELCQLLGYSGGKIRQIGYRLEYNDIGIVIEHPDMPFDVPHGGIIPQVRRKE